MEEVWTSLDRGTGHPVAEVYWFGQAGVGLGSLRKQRATLRAQPSSTDG